MHKPFIDSENRCAHSQARMGTLSPMRIYKDSRVSILERIQAGSLRIEDVDLDSDFPIQPVSGT